MRKSSLLNRTLSVATLTLVCAAGLDATVLAQTGASHALPPRFQPVHRLLADHVERRQIAGAVALVVHDGRVVFSDTVGLRDVEQSRPTTRDTLFRIASMTKPVTSVAVMMLLEEGRLELSDPLSKHLPEFANPTVLETLPDGGHRIVPARREITLHDLLTHTSGISYRFFGQEPLSRLYAGANVSDGLAETPGSLAENIRRLATVPLAHQPGEQWQYGLSTDVLGRVVEVVSGQSLDEFFQKRIFEPLRMTDTCFFTSKEQVPRLAALYQPADEGSLRRVGKGLQTSGSLLYSATSHVQGPRTFYSGGAGLVSTAPDYARFLQMLLNDGKLDGTRLLKLESVAAMTRNQIGELNGLFTVHGDKFGFGFGVHSEKGKRHGASIGTCSWGGLYHTYFWLDPQRKVIGLLLTQLYPSDHLSLRTSFQHAVYQALDASKSP
ncbi:MAG TPA: serine hydrolase domain-containing protein [Methylomirabilota bacterium]|nr:serine hydrolase domain-containing protein [Methylomirabilota bacterium]